MKSVYIFSAVLLIAAANGCNRSDTNPRTSSASHAHSHEMPHGGTPVQIGPHDYHLELVNDPQQGRMTAFVLDDHAEKPEPVPPTTFEMIARINGTEHRLLFAPLTNSAGGTVSAFTADAEWLKTVTHFQGLIPRITLGKETFENIAFPFPEGTRHSH